VTDMHDVDKGCILCVISGFHNGVRAVLFWESRLHKIPEEGRFAFFFFFFAL
jgi:hypothetical protein